MSETGSLADVQPVEIDYMELDSIIEEDFNNDEENLIMIIQAIQRRYNYLPEPALKYLATSINVPLSQIYGVATFYSTFSLKPRGRNIISICLGTACHVRGGERVRERIEECSLGPVVKINEDMHGNLSSDQVAGIIDQYE